MTQHATKHITLSKARINCNQCHSVPAESDLLAAPDAAAAVISAGFGVDHGGFTLLGLQLEEILLALLCLHSAARKQNSCVTSQEAAPNVHAHTRTEATQTTTIGTFQSWGTSVWPHCSKLATPAQRSFHRPACSYRWVGQTLLMLNKGSKNPRLTMQIFYRPNMTISTHLWQGPYIGNVSYWLLPHCCGRWYLWQITESCSEM